jgi:hypothetical protein
VRQLHTSLDALAQNACLQKQTLAGRQNVRSANGNARPVDVFLCDSCRPALMEDARRRQRNRARRKPVGRLSNTRRYHRQYMWLNLPLHVDSTWTAQEHKGMPR